MTELRGRALIESRYGPLWGGRQVVNVDGTDYDIAALMFHMGLNFEDARVIDVLEVSIERFVVRYYDGEDQRIVAHEFDAKFQFVGEIRAHIAEWIGEDGYYEWTRLLNVRCPADL
ncbi:MAG: hypothetical protein WBP79_01490 [Candidatus Acidiferrales bacterium]